MTDEQLIKYCADKCRAPKPLFAAWRVERMIRLAGNPRACAGVIDGSQFYRMTDSMELLVELARKRAARPAGGLDINVGRIYRDVNGELRRVVRMPPHHKSFDVYYESAAGNGCMRLVDFQAWALEEAL